MAATSSHQEQSFRQQRLALFAGVLVVLNGIGGLFQIITDTHPSLTRPANLVMFAEVAVAGLFLALLRRERTYARRTLDVAEASLLGLTAFITGLFAHAVPAQQLGALLDQDPTTEEAIFFSQVGVAGFAWAIRLSCTLGATLTFTLRAAIVPSTARRTLVLTALGGVVMSIAMAVPIPRWTASARIVAELPLGGLPMVVTVAIWWTLSTISCVAISKVVHGLRQEVRDARRLGQYQLESRLGAGGMGVVYRARHAMLRRPTATPPFAPPYPGPLARARDAREVRLTATLTHPNTVTIYDYGHTPEGVFYYAMELLEGASLEAIVEAGGPMAPARAVHVLRGVAAALAEAHAAGLIHRDIKPTNVMLARSGGVRDVPKLLDFGLVKELRPEGGALTEDSTLTGTPLYLAPECIREPAAASPRSDIYALGAVGFYLLTGTHVFSGRNVVDICGHHLHSAPERPSERLGRALPEGLDELVLACLAKEPLERPEGAHAFLSALRALDQWGSWSEEEAEAWWAAHAGAFATAGSAPSGKTELRIELGRRS